MNRIYRFVLAYENGARIIESRSSSLFRAFAKVLRQLSPSDGRLEPYYQLLAVDGSETPVKSLPARYLSLI